MTISVPVLSAPYAQRRRRAEELVERWPFAAEVLHFYLHVLDVQEAAFARAQAELVQPQEAAHFAARSVLPLVVEASAAYGPPVLQAGVLERFDAADLESVCAAWIRGEELTTFDRFLAHASVQPVLEACRPQPDGGHDALHCPACGGPPLVSYFDARPEDLVTPHRYLRCARCSESWAFARMTCAVCGETSSAKLRTYREAEQGGRFAHLRIDACSSCSRYVLNVDLGTDGRAVPEVDEIAAIPLDLYARELGLRKASCNVMGF
jgi:formate dehydrogenase maturation protein FdhE